MDTGLLGGLLSALTPTYLMFSFVGCLLGTLVGVLPGLGPAATTAILLPLTVYLDPTSALIMMGGIYYGASYGGSITSILVNVPGEASSVTTCLDGFQMTRRGKAGQALAIAAISSFIAGTLGALLISLLAPPLASLGLLFGPPEYCALVVFSLTALVSFSSRSPLKGLTAGLVGVFLATIGLDPLTGQARLTFGNSELLAGVTVTPVLMGMFGIAEVVASAEEGIGRLYEGTMGQMIPRGRELVKSLVAGLRGTGVGFALGLLPGMTPTVCSFVAYDAETRISKTPERFGTGVVEGVAAPEASNNAAAMAGFIPMMALGIPTSATMAIMLAALMMQGLTPGPLLFVDNASFAWTVIGSMYVGNVILVILNLPLVGLWARLSTVPYRYLGPVILAVCFVGAYSVRNSMFDVWIAITFGIIGYGMKKYGWPAAPLVLGTILGPMLERNLRAALQLSGGSPAILFNRPIAAVFMLFAIVLVAISVRSALVQTGKAAPDLSPNADPGTF